MARKITVSHKTAKIIMKTEEKKLFERDDGERCETWDRIMNRMKTILKKMDIMCMVRELQR